MLVSQGEGSNVLLFRGYSQHLEIKASFPTGWQSLHSTTVLPAGKRRSSVHLPSHVLLPSPWCQQQPLARQGRKPVQQPALEKQPSSPQNTLVFNEIRCLKARLHFSAAFQTLISTNSLSFLFFFFFFPVYFRDGETASFSQSPSFKERKR